MIKANDRAYTARITGIGHAIAERFRSERALYLAEKNRWRFSDMQMFSALQARV